MRNDLSLVYSMEENQRGFYSRALKDGISCFFSKCIPGRISDEVSSLLFKL